MQSFFMHLKASNFSVVRDVYDMSYVIQPIPDLDLDGVKATNHMIVFEEVFEYVRHYQDDY